MFAFFDVDGTLLTLRSMVLFQDFYLRRQTPWPEGFGALRSKLFSARLARWERRTPDRHVLNRTYYRTYRGRRPEVVRARATEWFDFEKQQRPELWIAPTVRVLEERKAQGYQPVLVSGSLHEILEPVARELGVEHCLATRLTLRDGRYTGEIEGRQMIGQGKAEAIREFLTTHGARSEECFAYGDHITDRSMLEAVGHPVAVIGDPKLAQLAQQRQWQCLTL